uniref:Uncharacterized protein n=1 Tax=Anopheles coluzzii TaxID=1518534 RepID=A0A8W7PLI5_ANOCL
MGANEETTSPRVSVITEGSTTTTGISFAIACSCRWHKKQKVGDLLLQPDCKGAHIFGCPEPLPARNCNGQPNKLRGFEPKTPDISLGEERTLREDQWTADGWAEQKKAVCRYKMRMMRTENFSNKMYHPSTTSRHKVRVARITEQANDRFQSLSMTVPEGACVEVLETFEACGMRQSSNLAYVEHGRDGDLLCCD